MALANIRRTKDINEITEGKENYIGEKRTQWKMKIKDRQS
jgi:hypothetical protein